MTVAELFAVVLAVPQEDVTDETSPANTASWTSMAHIQLVVTIEDVYGVRLSAAEVKAMTSVAAARDLLTGRGAALA